MNELQISLLGVGVFLVLAVFAYNWQQQRKYRREYGAAFRHEHADALYHTVTELPADEEPAPEEDDSPMPDEVLADEVPHGYVNNEVCALLSDDTDYIALITPKSPAGTDALAPLWQQRFDFDKSVNVCGLNTASGEWERVIADSPIHYSSFKLALQLVNRSGAVSEAKLTSFRALAQAVTVELRAHAVLPDPKKIAERAGDLDKFCASVDQLVALNILAGAGELLAGEDIAHVAEQYDLNLQADGTFHLIDAQGQTLLSLCNEDNTPFQHQTLGQVNVACLTLLLDVPHTEQPTIGFDQMVTLAQKLAGRLGASVVDAHHATLSDAGIALIREQISVVEERMRIHKIPAGSAQARRLFP
jgi:ZipA, C-terminal FtsZ-binding domain